MLSEIEEVDVAVAINEFCFPEKLSDSAGPRMRDIRTISAVGADLYLVCTSQPITNLQEDKHYVKPTAAVVERMDNCSTIYPDVTNNRFTDVFRILTSFAKWRQEANGRTILIMSPPPFHYIASWERAFAAIGVVTAWVEDGKYQLSQYSMAPDIKKKIVLDIEARDETSQVEQMLPGQKIAMWRVAGKSQHELANIRARLRRICLRVEQANQDRRFATIIQPRTSRWAYVYRMTEDEYDDWAGFLPYEYAVLQHKGGKTIAHELKQAVES
jgi:hypothetical protein